VSDWLEEHPVTAAVLVLALVGFGVATAARLLWLIWMVW
jgi:hypothetical protein